MSKVKGNCRVSKQHGRFATRYFTLHNRHSRDVYVWDAESFTLYHFTPCDTEFLLNLQGFMCVLVCVCVCVFASFIMREMDLQ